METRQKVGVLQQQNIAKEETNMLEKIEKNKKNQKVGDGNANLSFVAILRARRGGRRRRQPAGTAERKVQNPIREGKGSAARVEAATAEGIDQERQHRDQAAEFGTRSRKGKRGAVSGAVPR